MEKAQAEARAILDEARSTADQVFQELNDMRRRQRKEEDWQAVNDQRAGLRHRLNEAEDALGARPEEPAPPPTRPARAGDTVELVKMGTQATVLSVNKDGVLQLQAGILRITAKQEEVRVVEGETQTQKQARQYIQRAEHKLRSLGASPEVDLRGMMTDEAVGALDLFLDNAVLGKLNEVTHHPRQGHRRGAQGGAGAPQAQPVCQVLPPRPLRRGRGRRDHRRAEIDRGPARGGVRGITGQESARQIVRDYH